MSPTNPSPIRRIRAAELLATESAQRTALPRFAAALRRAVDPAGGVSHTERAALLGVPSSRRGFLRLGGVTVAAGAVLVACGDADDAGVNRSGVTPGPSEGTIPEPQPSAALDTTLLATAGSLEALAVAAYDAVLEADWLGSADLNSVAALFRDQHAEHLDAVSAATRDAGATPYTNPNPFLAENVVDPAVAEVAALDDDDERTTATINLAIAIEDIAAQTYTSAGGLFSTPELRQAGMSIGAVEARHISVLLGALAEPQVPFAFGRTVNAVGEEALVTPTSSS